MKMRIRKRMRDRDTSRDMAEIIDCPRDIQLKYKEYGYDKCLRIVLYGTPYTDSRPKINTKTLGTSNKNMIEMKVSFGRFYKSNELLQNTVIMSHYHMGFRAYLYPSQPELRYFKREATKRELELYEKEKLGHLSIQDLDNMLKIHNDILFEPEFRILLDDAWNIGFDQPLKTLTPNKDQERAEIMIYYNSKPSPFYRWKMEQSARVRKWVCSVKHMNMCKRPLPQQVIHLKKQLGLLLQDQTSEEKVRKILKDFSKFLEKEYTSTMLKDLADLEQTNRYNKFDSMFKLMTILTQGHPVAEKIIARGGTA